MPSESWEAAERRAKQMFEEDTAERDKLLKRASCPRCGAPVEPKALKCRACGGEWAVSQDSINRLDAIFREVFGGDCPVCSHGLTVHNAFGWCQMCGLQCSNRAWPPESVERYREACGLAAGKGGQGTAANGTPPPPPDDGVELIGPGWTALQAMTGYQPRSWQRGNHDEPGYLESKGGPGGAGNAGTLGVIAGRDGCGGEPLVPGRDVFLGPRWGAEDQKREDATFADLTDRVEDALIAVVEGSTDYGEASGHLGCSGFQEMAEAAVGVFIQFLRTPPPVQ